MKTNLSKLLFLSVILLSFHSIAQSDSESSAKTFYHELSFGAGPVSFRGDYGENEDNETNLNNTGVGFFLMHHLTFTLEGNETKYFNRHFKIRNQIAYHSTKLNHYGQYIDNASGLAFDQLDGMSATVNAFEIGTGLDWFLKDIAGYDKSSGTFSPYAGFGIGVIISNPENETSLNGELGADPSVTFGTFLDRPNDIENNPINNTIESALALNFQAGTKFRLNDKSELFLEARWHFYNSDYIEGLAPFGDQNQNKDWNFMLALGYSFRIDID